MKTYSLDEAQDLIIGKVGTARRDQYEFELKIELIGEMIKATRKERNITQEQLGKLIGVKKSQISKLENGTRNVTIETVLKVFEALKVRVNLKVELLDNEISTV